MADKYRGIEQKRVSDMLEDTDANYANETNAWRSRRGLRSQLSPPFFRDKTDRSNPAVRRDVKESGFNASPPVTPGPGPAITGKNETGYARGGKVGGTSIHNYCAGGKVISSKKV